MIWRTIYRASGPCRLISFLLVFVLGLPPVSVHPQEYTARAGDELDVLVVGEPDFSRPVTVSAEGTLFLPLVGGVSVTGLTIQQIEERLRQALLKYVKDPKVLVTFRQANPQANPRDVVFVLGQVVRPGSYDVHLGSTVLELLALSGGPTDRAAIRRALVIRKIGATSKPVNIEKLMGGDLSQNEPLKAGDVLVVPDNTARVLVVGEVAKPGYVTLSATGVGGGHIVDVITDAGGPTLKADPVQISIMRDGQKLKANLDALLRLGDTAQDVEVQPGDIVYVPETQDRLLVLGAVAKPGIYTMSTTFPMRVMDAIMLAGGPADPASMKDVTLVRQNGEKPTGIQLNLWDFLRSGKLDQNVPLKPGDVIYVPHQNPNVNNILNILTGLTMLRFIIFGNTNGF